ncbi:MAG: hypothetical protein J7K71_02605, partial [Candidatus Omnitrophica bacterium]|nr:hypothetical protein [Candidatus Omnitrophota bacterium]
MFLSKKFRITPFFVIFNVIIIYLLALFIKLGISFFFFLFKFLIILEVIDFNLWLIEILESRKIKIRRNVKEKAIEGEKLSVNI